MTRRGFERVGEEEGAKRMFIRREEGNGERRGGL